MVFRQRTLWLPKVRQSRKKKRLRALFCFFKHPVFADYLTCFSPHGKKMHIHLAFSMIFVAL